MSSCHEEEPAPVCHSQRGSAFLPLVTVPQVLVIGWVMNQFG